MAKYTCPYCMREHKFEEVEFQCVNKFCKEKVQDEKVAQYLGVPVSAMPMTNAAFPYKVKGPRFLTRGLMPASETCPSCKVKTSKRVCPSCHNELPAGVQENEDMIIAVVGGRDTGKSHFISVLIHELQTRICPLVMDGTFNAINDDVYQRYMENFYNRVYIQGEVLDLTPPVLSYAESSAKKPLIYEMVIPVTPIKNRRYTFVFYDTAGEDVKNAEIMQTVNRYIGKASGIIFLLDPVQMLELRRQMDDDEIRSSSSISEREIEAQENVLRRVASLIRAEKGIHRDGKINIPVSITFSKYDVLKRFFPKGSMVLQPSGYLKDGTLNKQEWFTVNQEIEAMLKECGEASFVQNVRNNFSRYSFFTVSALGQQPQITKGGKKIREPKPHRVEDPFLWLLKENNVISQK